MEYAIHGNLRNFLRAHRPDNKDTVAVQPYNNVTRWHPNVMLCMSTLTEFALQIAHGMEHLASLKVE
jgi:Protein tyrosine and serine/threonine kinase